MSKRITKLEWGLVGIVVAALLIFVGPRLMTGDPIEAKETAGKAMAEVDRALEAYAAETGFYPPGREFMGPLNAPELEVLKLPKEKRFEMKYWTDGKRFWFLVHPWPNQEYEMSDEFIRRVGPSTRVDFNTVWPEIQSHLYDPTNGAYSPGDLMRVHGDRIRLLELFNPKTRGS